MPMIKTDLSRRYVLSVSKNGACFIKDRDRRNEGLESGTLPVFSTNTHEEAEMLIVRHCRLSREDGETYFLNNPPVDLDDLGRISDLFRVTFRENQARESRV